MTQAILTIIVPTYNRATHLVTLLEALRAELQGLETLVKVLVSDNASTDSTPEVTAEAAHDWPALKIQRHDQNLGPEGNFLSCIPRVSTRYFWIIGDDDCPKRGVIAKLVRLLVEKRPALLYMQSEWVNPILGPDQGETVGDLRVSDLTTLQFAEAVHVWVTFISGMVIDKDRLLDVLGDHCINRFDATSLVQLGWVLPLLRSEGPFLFISDRCVLATKDNSGGYGLLTVFGANFPRIVSETFGASHPLSRALIDGHIMQYLPGLIWGARSSGRRVLHTPESPWVALNEQLGSRWLYWLLIVPLGRLPRFMAQPFFQTWRVLNRLRRVWRQYFGADMNPSL
ncbi:glycosyltransferase family 2 protein [Limnohabitans sp. DCL3]|uniref:glycosyltransferase family 2 protein n=1 Tax=Limnohabitans sp. DCL3 TaxID=3374103 RepID=UPI003A8C5EA0